MRTKLALCFGVIIFILLSVVGEARSAYTHFSRANCSGNNESISWDWPEMAAYYNWSLFVHSTHQRWYYERPNWNPAYGFEITDPNPKFEAHIVTDGYSEFGAYRIAAIHTREAWPHSGWNVNGMHFVHFPTGSVALVAQSHAVDCNLSYFFPY